MERGVRWVMIGVEYGGYFFWSDRMHSYMPPPYMLKYQYLSQVEQPQTRVLTAESQLYVT